MMVIFGVWKLLFYGITWSIWLIRCNLVFNDIQPDYRIVYFSLTINCLLGYRIVKHISLTHVMIFKSMLIAFDSGQMPKDNVDCLYGFDITLEAFSFVIYLFCFLSLGSLLYTNYIFHDGHPLNG